MTKYYLFNHQNHKDSFFSSPHEIAVYLMGRRLSNYSIMLCDKHGKPYNILNTDIIPSFVTEIETWLETFRNDY